VLRDAQIKKPDLVAVNIGPGSYTGIRVGLAAAKGLAFGWQCPIAGVSNLHALAYQADAGCRVACAVDARKGDIYAAILERPAGERGALAWDADWRPGIVKPAELAAKAGSKPIAIVGNAAKLAAQAFDSKTQQASLIDLSYPAAESIAFIGHALYQLGRLDDTLSLSPVYMRPSAPEQAAGRKRRRSAKA